jgi:hypothetical protein
MKKVVFVVLGIIGFISISVAGFVIPKDPYKIVPAISIMGFDKPLWVCYMFGGGIIYIFLLYLCYDAIKYQKKGVKKYGKRKKRKF